MKFRKPRLRISKSGKISLGGFGASIGGKKARLNISKSGVSGTVGAKGQSFNTKRGFNCGLIALFALTASITSIVAATYTLWL